MRRSGWWMAVLATTVLALTAPPPVAASAPRGDEYAARLDTAIRDLPVRAENRRGYDRDEFEHWIDADGDGCSTREEVLIAEAVEPPTVGAGCELSDGEWFSYYDGETWTDTGDLDIDHLVPLAEAWDSGARRWRAAVRRRFANDLGDRRSLVAVTDNVNQSKSDGDLADWLPEKKQCRYLREMVAVKHRWRLRVDRPEKKAMRALAEDCANKRVRVTLAR